METGRSQGRRTCFCFISVSLYKTPTTLAYDTGKRKCFACLDHDGVNWFSVILPSQVNDEERETIKELGLGIRE